MRSMGAAAVFDIAAAVPPIMKSTKKAVASVGFVLVILTEVLLKTNSTSLIPRRALIDQGGMKDTESTARAPRRQCSYQHRIPHSPELVIYSYIQRY